MTAESDELPHLLAGFRRSDPQLSQEFLNRAFPVLRRWCRRPWLRDLADDIAQQTLLLVIAADGGFPQECAVEAYLWGHFRNACRQVLRRAGRRRGSEGRVEQNEVQLEKDPQLLAAPPRLHESRLVAQIDARAEVGNLLTNLQPRMRRALRRLLEGESMLSAAKAEGVCRFALKRALRSARSKAPASE